MARLNQQGDVPPSKSVGARVVAALEEFAADLERTCPVANDLPAIEWVGDVSDDCRADWGGMLAHVELMWEYEESDHEEDESPHDPPSWFAAVYLTEPNLSADAKTLFHNFTHGVHLPSGVAARWLCELIMRAYAAGLYQPPQVW